MQTRFPSSYRGYRRREWWLHTVPRVRPAPTPPRRGRGSSAPKGRAPMHWPPHTISSAFDEHHLEENIGSRASPQQEGSPNRARRVAPPSSTRQGGSRGSRRRVGSPITSTTIPDTESVTIHHECPVPASPTSKRGAHHTTQQVDLEPPAASRPGGHVGEESHRRLARNTPG